MKRGFFGYFIFFYKPHGRCRCVSAVKYILRIYSYILRNIPGIYLRTCYFVASYCCAAVVCCVHIQHSAHRVPCCLFHTTAPCQMKNLLALSRATMYSKLDSKNRASELAKQSGLPSTPALRATQCCFPPPPVIQHVLEKSGCCNAVTEARLLSLVHTSAQNRKYPFHKRGGWLNQRDVLCNIIRTNAAA